MRWEQQHIGRGINSGLTIPWDTVRVVVAPQGEMPAGGVSSRLRCGNQSQRRFKACPKSYGTKTTKTTQLPHSRTSYSCIRTRSTAADPA